MNARLHANVSLDRRGFLIGGTGLMVSFGAPSGGLAAEAPGADGADTGPSRQRLDSWLAIDAQGHVIASVGKIDAGLGLPTALAQIVADELDVDIAQVHIRMGDTAITVDQRGTGSSNGITDGGAALRLAAAQARVFLIARAAQRWGLPAAELSTQDGAVRVTSNVSSNIHQSLTYIDLLQGQRFDIGVDAKTPPPFKTPQQARYVGQSVPRVDIPLKVTAAYRYLVDLQLPGMLHARVLRPPTAGAQLLGVDAMPNTPGFIQLVTRGNFAAVVCETEAQAVLAAREAKLLWSAPTQTWPGHGDALYASLRKATVKSRKVDRSNGDVDTALQTAARTLEAHFEVPFQSHASMGPACALARITAQGATVWMGGQKPYPLRPAVAEMLNMPTSKVRVVWLPGPGSYGMNDADDAALDCVLITQLLTNEVSHSITRNRPLRLQYSRADATAWDPKGPPGVFHLRAGLDSQNRVTAFDYLSRGYSGRTRPSGTSRFGDSLTARLSGGPATRSEELFQMSSENYTFDNKRVAGELVDWEHSLATGLRTAHLRDPDGLATCFASESFIDELAFASSSDPLQFRLRYLAEPRAAAVLRAAAARANWQTRVGPQASIGGSQLTGRGIAYAPRNGAFVAIVAEVEVNAQTGRWRATRFTVAHDCGRVINPRSLERVIESNVLMSLSRVRFEEVQFDAEKVISTDWASYPTLDMTDVPDAIDVVLVGNSGTRFFGAGEPSTRPMTAALANALFDATGRRLRCYPFTPQRLLAALSTPRMTD